MKIKAIVVFIVLAAFAAAINYRQSLTQYTPPTEADMEKMVPPTVDGFEYVKSMDNPMQSYKMGESTYEMLKPFGIVSRIYEKPGRSFDVVIIGGDNADSFHDQRGCFSGQGWTIGEQTKVMIPTKAHGDLPAWLIGISNDTGGKRLAMYLFRGPTGFHAEFMDMWWDFFRSELRTGKPNKGVFYRFIALEGDTTREELIGFAADFMDAANDYSDGTL